MSRGKYDIIYYPYLGVWSGIVSLDMRPGAGRERGEEAGVVVHAPVAVAQSYLTQRTAWTGWREGRPVGGREGGREGGMRRRRRRRRRLAELALRRRAVGGWNRAFLPPHCIPAGAAAGHVRVGAAVLRQLGGRAGIRGPIQMQKFWLEFWLENWLEILLEIFFTGKSPKMGSLDMSQNQKVISSQFSSQISSQNFCF